MTAGLCFYCGTPQPGHHAGDELFRCHRCNLYMRGSWLVTGQETFELDNSRPWLCPWCAYPVAIEQKVPTDGSEFLCDGCNGTLIADMMVTQANVDAERKVSMKSRSYLLFVLLAVFTLWIIFGFVMK